MKYVYGPVRSRRLGLSLGISTVPYKVCNLDCVYCQLKSTTFRTRTRSRYAPEREILEEVRTFFAQKEIGQRVDHVTFSGSGEPTLHASIGRLIRQVKKISGLPVVLITNSTTLIDPRVRRAVTAADIIIPSLDAVTQDIFKEINRPAPGVRVEKMIEALIALRRIYRGKLWLEVMLVRGVNDAASYLALIKKAADRIRPDRVQVNSPVRPPALPWVKPVSKSVLQKAKKIFGPNCDII